MHGQKNPCKCLQSDIPGGGRKGCVASKNLDVQLGLILLTQLRSQFSPCEICYGHSGTVTGFCPSTSVSPCQYHSTNAPHSIFVYMLLLPERQRGKAWEPPKNQCCFGNRGALERKVLLLNL